ncbi:MAG: hypothetical protein SynsKO_14780 [Synoicihabitans sp.]
METPRLLIILDLDETLVRATGNPTLDPPDFMLGDYRVRRRPMLDSFLCSVSKLGDLAIWSSGNDGYVDAIVSEIVPRDIALRFVWSRSRCTRQFDSEHLEEYWVKDLKKVKRLGFSLERVLIVDDTPEKIERHYGNHIFIEPFYGDLGDRVLPKLAAYLQQFTQIENVRDIEKRGWIDSIETPIS